MADRFDPLGEGPILVALSEPRYARSALAVARTLCAQVDRSVILLHASIPAIPSEELLEQLGLTSQELTGFVIEPLEGAPEVVILEYARARHGSLLILGLGAEGAEPGRVVRRLLTEAPCPLLFVPPELREHWGEAGKVLLPLDGMPSTSAVAPLAIDMALRSGAELEILYVGMAFPPSEPGSMALPSFIDQPQYEWARWKREFLYRFGECHWGGKLPVDAQLVLATGNPGEAILEQAERHGPDLIVIGWHGELSHSHARTLRTLLAKAHWVLLVARV